MDGEDGDDGDDAMMAVVVPFLFVFCNWCRAWCC